MNRRPRSATAAASADVCQTLEENQPDSQHSYTELFGHSHDDSVVDNRYVMRQHHICTRTSALYFNHRWASN